MQKIICFLIAVFVFILSACNPDSNEAKPSFSSSLEDISKELIIPEPKYNAFKLKKEIEGIIGKSSAKWSVYIEGLNDFVNVEIGGGPVIAASVIKLFNMVCLYNEMYTNGLVLSDSDRRKLNLMICESSNTASNDIVTLIGNGDFSEGAKKVTDFAVSIGCTDTREEHMLFDDIAPVKGRNRISAKDCAILLKKLYNKELVSEEYDAEMVDLLKKQTRKYKISAGVPKGTVVANKTGETSRVQHDAGIVFSPAGDYIICVLVSDYNSEGVIRKISEISKATYNFFNSETDISAI